MFVLGIDPGLSRCGYCVLETLDAPGSAGREARPAALGVLRTPPGEPIWLRLASLQREVRSLVGEFTPAAVAIERVLFQVNVRTAMGVGQASGIVMAEAVVGGASVAEYSPNQVKEAIAGWGAAPKEQVQQMVAMLLDLPGVPEPADAADAAAVALCHLAIAGSMGEFTSDTASAEALPTVEAVEGGGQVRNRVRLRAKGPAEAQR